MKLIIEYLEQLPKKYRKHALHAHKESTNKSILVNSMPQAILYGFNWEHTPRVKRKTWLALIKMYNDLDHNKPKPTKEKIFPSSGK